MNSLERPIDWEKIAEMTLALMYLTTFEEGYGGVRSWKGHSWDALKKIHDKGWIDNPIGKAKSVALTEQGERLSRELFERHFVGPPVL